MKKIVFSIFIFLLCLSSFCQHTNYAKSITESLTEAKSKTDTLYYPNGKIWTIQTQTTYKYETETYTYLTNQNLQYYRNGKLLQNIIFDNFGIPISWKKFDNYENLFSETITIEIDTNAKNLKEFLENDETITIKKLVKNYRCSNKTKKLFVYKSGYTINNKKTGLWTKFYENGSIKSQKKH